MFASMNNAHLLANVAQYIETIVVSGGYSVLFITTLLEGIPVIGMAVPGHVTIILGGFLAKIGTLGLWPVILISSIGAVAGDFIGFYFGRRFGMSFIDKIKPYFSSTGQYVEKAQDLLSKHTGKAMIIGRFSPVTRAIMPFLVGASKTDSKKFWIFNIIGGIAWVLSSVFLGYAFGASYHLVAGYFGKFVIVALILTALIVWGYRFVNMRFHVFAKYEIITLIINIVSMWILFKTVQDTWAPSSSLLNLDLWVNNYMYNITTLYPWIAKIGYIISFLAETEVIAFIGLVIGLIFAIKRRWRRSGIVVLTILSTGISLGIMKEFFARLRPENAIQVLSSFSFPSGHAGFSAALFTVIAYLLIQHMHSWIKREVLVVVCVVAIVLVGLSRIVLNVHWTSDVIAGWSLGVFMATSSILFVRYVSALVTRSKNN
jgi:undecaprenyl-diphosphatase